LNQLHTTEKYSIPKLSKSSYEWNQLKYLLQNAVKQISKNWKGNKQMSNKITAEEWISKLSKDLETFQKPFFLNYLISFSDLLQHKEFVNY
jgi:hypothetical protein